MKAGLPVFSWPETFPDSVRQLDTRLHAVFEASAGTGKTYAIEHLVLRLLVENAALEPQEILLLSFTEKTAADLRKRIRDRLHLEWAGANKDHWSPPLRERIHKLWQHSEDLAIHTIHGFCHAALLRYPIANDALIRPDVLDDKTLADVALENLLRGPWAADPARLTKLREALDISAKDGWRDRLIAVALAFQEKRGDELYPPPDPLPFEEIQREVATEITELRDRMRRVEECDFPLIDYLSRLPDSKRAGNAFGKVEDALKTHSRELPLLNRLLELFYGKFDPSEIKEGKTRAFRKGFSGELDSTRGRTTAQMGEWQALAATCTRVLKLALKFKVEEHLAKLRILAGAAIELREELAKEKQRRGAISFDDMTQNLAEALVRNPELAPKLRQLYKVCIVDEFQDTDLQQWTILQALCLSDATGGPSAAEPPLLPLFLVGDPKQAIYSFRGGDLQTYLAARETLRALAEQNPPRAQGVSLDENFRSRPNLIESLNTVFSQPTWFQTEDESPRTGAWKLSESKDIVFTPVKPGLKPKPLEDGTANGQPETPALWIRDLRYDGLEKKPTKRKVERELRTWIASRIQKLTSGRDGFTLLPKHEAVRRAPRFGDIAVLVRKHTEAAALEKLLRKLGIPCRVRRTGGVFQGEGADALRLLLDLLPAAANPATQAKILMLPFLRRTGTDWPEGLPETLPTLLERWIFLANAGRWPEFFDSVLVTSGHLARVAESSESDAKRLLALGRALGEAGATPGTSIGALADRFDALRRGEGEGDEGIVEDGTDEDSQDSEDEVASGGTQALKGGAVTIMTLHMSKGLEFPIVFLGAAGAGRRPEFYTLREEHAFKHVLDKADDISKAIQKKQSEDEDRRLFYVAFTRAKDRLYAPLLPVVDGNTDYGPLGGFACEALVSAANSPMGPDDTLVRWDADELDTKVAAVETSTASTSTSVLDSGRDPAPTLAVTESLFQRQRKLNSYSGLAKRATGATDKTLVSEMIGEDGKRAVRDEITVTVPPQDSLAEATPHAPITREELPAGAAAGNVLHHVLEITEFVSVLEAKSPEAWLEAPGRRAEVETQLRHEGLNPECSGAVARAVWNTLRMPIPDPANPGATFRLADNAEHLHEVEFLFPVVSNGSGASAEKTEQRGDFLWGFIDLVFRHEGRYYVLDWKSNLLGNSPDDYATETVEAAMLASGYDLQWQLYSVAVDRWLRETLPGYDPDRHFGGVLYVYLRGASPDRFSGYQYRPDREDLANRYPERLGNLLGLKFPAFKSDGNP